MTAPSGATDPHNVPPVPPVPTSPTPSGALVRTPAADDRLRRRLDYVRLVIATALAVMGVACLRLLADDGPQLIEVLLALLVLVVGLALIIHHRVGAAIAARRASREASMTRILQGLSRSLSPDAVVDAIVQELTSASGADHVVVARVRQPDQVVEVTLSAANANVPASRTYLRPDVPGLSTDPPITEVPGAAGAAAMAAGASARLEGRLASDAERDAEAAEAEAAEVEEVEEATDRLASADDTGAYPAPVASDGSSTKIGAASAYPGAASAAAASAASVGDATPGDRPDGRPAAVSVERPEVAAERTARLRRPGFGPFASGSRAVTSQVPGRRAQLASQAAADEIARKVRSAYGLPYTLAAALVAEGRFLGALILSKRTRESWSDGDRRLLTWAAREVAAAFARAYALEEAERGAHTDALTGLPNRRSFDDLIAIVPYRRRTNDDLGILMVDIDRFKSLNDRHGHATGDSVLRAVAAAIAATVRAEDTPARYGGEEFAVILRRASAPQAAEVGERVRRAVATMPPDRLGVDLPVTVSVGVAVADQEEDITAVIERADRALYEAKRRGRNRVEIG